MQEICGLPGGQSVRLFVCVYIAKPTDDHRGPLIPTSIKGQAAFLKEKCRSEGLAGISGKVGAAG